MSSRSWLLTPGLWVLRAASGTALGAPLDWVLKRTVFRHYCGGETLADCHRVRRQLEASQIKMVVDHSQEERERPEDWEDNLASKKALFRSVASEMSGSCKFIPLKVTSLMSPRLLETVTSVVVKDATWVGKLSDAVLSELREEDSQLWLSSEQRLRHLCNVAREVGVSVWMDAEQSHRQPAIDILAQRLMREFNTNGQPPVLFNTYQLYLRDGDARVLRDLKQASREGYVFAAKCVRGAYMVSEAERAEQHGSATAVHQDKTATDIAFDSAVKSMIEAIGRGEEAALAICTHNELSVRRAISAMLSNNVPTTHPNIHFAQILGMCDNVTAALSTSGYNAHKLVLFGDYGDLFPWLLRRIDENRDMLGGCQAERPVLWRAWTQRLRGQ